MSTDKSQHWARQGERGSMALLRLMAWIAVTFGRRVARLILHPITLYFVLFAPAARRRSKRYLARALGHPPHVWDGYRHVHAFASTILDRVYFARGQLSGFEITMHGGELVEQALAQGSGAVLLGAHMGSFEALHAVGAHHAGLRVAMVMYPDNARKIHAVLQAIAPDLHMDIIAMGRSGSTLAIRDWLQGGGLVGMLGDRRLDADAPRGGTVALPFLGVDAQFSDGPLRLAQLLRQKVVFMVGLYHGGGRYEIRFESLADFSQRPAEAAAREQQVRDALAAYVRLLENLCREAPYNWFNFHDFWDEDAAN